MTQAINALRNRIESSSATVAVIGLGYVGLPLLHAVVKAGFPAIGIDHDPDKITQLRAGGNYLPHLGDELAADVGREATLAHTDDALADADVILICVPTPLHEDRTPDLTYVERAARAIRTHRVEGAGERACLVCLESTTWPGTCREVIMPALGSGGGVLVAFSPEREDPGNRTYTTVSIPKLVGGVDEASTDLAAAFYGSVVERVVRCSTSEIAEAAKLVENVYRSVNIALVNELKVVLEAMGLNVWDVLDAASTKPFGYQRFDPGPGFGGHCVPIDPYYLAWKARAAGVESRFIELAGDVNRAMPARVVERCVAALAESGVSLSSSHVLVLGLAYKRNVADVRESPSFEIIELLRSGGARVEYHDPHVQNTWPGRRHDLGMASVAWSAETLSAADAVIIATDHDWYDWQFVADHARLVIDTRHAMAGTESGRAKIVRA